MKLKPMFLGCAFFLTLAAHFPSLAQSDNFDGGALDPAWKRSHFNPALVNISFPDVGTGKALRIQASPVPDAAPAAAMFYREDVYTDFYMAVDIVDWPGTDKNQAIVLIARASLSANPAETTGIIMNYDASQEGEGATDRRQGQLQINMVTNSPAFGTKTLAVAEVTFVPGRPYRLVFEGVGSHYTAKAYDLHDLTSPLVTIEADDDIQGPIPDDVTFEGGGFKSGVCGFLSFSREGTSGTTDVTIDNYFASATGPKAATAPALAHPVPGTPAIESRVPADRFRNFYDPAFGIVFTAKTHTTNTINAGATKLRLNGADVSSHLNLPANGTTMTAQLPASALAANRVYSAQIELEDATGFLKSTNTFWFDTFSDEYLSGMEVRIIEAEDYNFNGGAAQGAYPVPVSGLDTNGLPVDGGGSGYWEQVGIPEIDFHDADEFPESPWNMEYRSLDAVGLSAGMYPEITDLNESEDNPVRRSDAIRAKYALANLLEYVVHRTEPGEWLNYTRSFPDGDYAVYLRVASLGATDVELHHVTSDPAQPDQITSKLGTFRVPNLFARYNYRYVELVTDAGAPATVNLSGAETLRLQMAGTAGQDANKIAMNYLVFVPQPPVASLAVESSATINGPYTLDASATIAPGLNAFSIPLTAGNRFFRLRGTGAVRITEVRNSDGTLILNWATIN